jgi:hypothetical protein
MTDSLSYPHGSPDYTKPQVKTVIPRFIVAVPEVTTDSAAPEYKEVRRFE